MRDLKDPVQFDKHDDLPYDTHCHLLSLEVWIGNLDGMDLTRWQNGEGSEMHGTDEGTIDADDAVKAVNAMIAAIRYLKTQRDGAWDAYNKATDALKEVYAEMSEAGADFTEGTPAAVQAVLYPDLPEQLAANAERFLDRMAR